MQLQQNTILITGGTSGIGLELVHKFYSLKNKIIVTSSNQNNLDNLKIEFPEIEIILCDLANDMSVHALIQKCLTDFGEINIVINNAGMQHNYNWIDEDNGFDKIENEIRINLTSPMKIMYGLLSLLSTKKSSAIVNVSSGLAFAPKKSAPIYCATKSAIHTGTKALRYQLEKSNIKIFEIIPPLVDTKMTKGRGSGKITTTQLVDEFLVNFKKDKFESNIGKTKLLRLLQRILPQVADNLLKNS
jgi:uncharacterized oxidoreductase